MTSAVAALRRFAGAPPGAERCDGCGVALAGDHDHLVAPGTRTLRCACTACALMLAGPAGAPVKRVRRRVQRLSAEPIEAATWTALGVPIGLAFFVRRAAGVVALYPSPAGLVESEVTAGAWRALLAALGVVADLEEDVEALLVNRLSGTEACYRVSVDACYRLAGLVRLHWSGLGGGSTLAQTLRRFFEELDGA